MIAVAATAAFQAEAATRPAGKMSGLRGPQYRWFWVGSLSRATARKGGSGVFAPEPLAHAS